MKNRDSGILFYIRNYGFNSLFIRNFIIILLIILISSGGLIFVVYDFTTRNAQKEIEALNLQSLNRTKDTLDTIFNETERLGIQLCLEDKLQSFILNPSPENITQEKYDDILKTMNMFTLIYDYIDSIYICSNQNQWIVTRNYIGPIDKFMDNNWYKNYLKNKNSDIDKWFESRKLVNEYGEYPYLITLVKPVKLYPPDSIGAVAVNINVEKLNILIDNMSNAANRNLFITDDSGTILFNKDLKLISTKIQDQVFYDSRMLEGKEYTKMDKRNNLQQTITSLTSKDYNFRYMAVVPVEYYNERIKGLSKFIISFISVSAAISIAISLIISIKVYTPIKNIIAVINGERLQKKNGTEAGIKKANEASYITGSILNSLTSYKKIEQELASNILIIQKAQTLALQSQINPHFLHNTLETIQIMVIKAVGFQNPAIKMLTALSDMLRISMESKEYLIPLGDEITHCKRYLDILNIRYSDKLYIEWQISEDLLQYKVVKLSLQPIIENAVYHGIKPKREKGKIMIKGYFKDENIVVEIMDDGIGMPKEKIEAINTALNNEFTLDDEHVGVANVNKRIKLIFGDKYGVLIDELWEIGTRVVITIPAVKNT